MEQIYALGVSCIEIVQYWFQDYGGYFEFVNELANPHYAVEILFPLVSILDSVFASQLLLCTAFGGWLNSVMKWWLLEERPYWWVRETSFYENPPQLRQTDQTCETGPGSPSGHSANMSMLLVLATMWMSHVMSDRKRYIWWWKYATYPVFGATLLSVMLARLYIATHFPHQVIFGALIGSFLAPALCIYITDPFFWRYGIHSVVPHQRAVAWHTVSAVLTIAVAAFTYIGLKGLGIDPQGTVKLAFRWCENPNAIRVSTTPLYALVQCTGHLFGWALCVTPAVTKYRHDTANRSVIISALMTGLIWYIIKHIENNVCKADALHYYSILFLLAAVKPPSLLRLAPSIAMWPFSDKEPKNKVE